jgi:hypothetical protein
MKKSKSSRASILSKRSNVITPPIGKSKMYIIVEIHVPGIMAKKTEQKKTAGPLSSSSSETRKELTGKISPFDNYIQIIAGAAEIIINNKKYKLKLGKGLIPPARILHKYSPGKQFKMISSIMKA